MNPRIWKTVVRAHFQQFMKVFVTVLMISKTMLRKKIKKNPLNRDLLHSIGGRGGTFVIITNQWDLNGHRSNQNPKKNSIAVPDWLKIKCTYYTVVRKRIFKFRL